jgi:hypothetical protein
MDDGVWTAQCSGYADAARRVGEIHARISGRIPSLEVGGRRHFHFAAAEGADGPARQACPRPPAVFGESTDTIFGGLAPVTPPIRVVPPATAVAIDVAEVGMTK